MKCTKIHRKRGFFEHISYIFSFSVTTCSKQKKGTLYYSIHTGKQFPKLQVVWAQKSRHSRGRNLGTLGGVWGYLGDVWVLWGCLGVLGECLGTLEVFGGTWGDAWVLSGCFGLTLFAAAAIC